MWEHIGYASSVFGMDHTMDILIAYFGSFILGIMLFVVLPWFDWRVAIESPEDKDLSTNVGILYLTLMAALLTVATNWPVEGWEFDGDNVKNITLLLIGLVGVVSSRVVMFIIAIEEYFGS